jgi:hypothetical protein
MRHVICNTPGPTQDPSVLKLLLQAASCKRLRGLGLDSDGDVVGAGCQHTS